MPTEVVKTIRASGGDYTSLSAWQTAEVRDLVAADEIAVAEMYDDWASPENHYIEARGDTGWTTDATRYIHIRAAAGHETDGTKTKGPNLLGSNATYGAFRFIRIHAKISGIRINSSAPSRKGFGIFLDSSTQYLTFDSCVMIGGGDYVASIDALVVGTELTFNACATFGFRRPHASGATLANIVYKNCVHADFTEYAFLRVYAENSVGYNSGTSDFAIMASGSNYNASSDASAPGANSIISITSADFVDAANDDFHLSASSGLRGQGANLYSDFQYDIDGDEWPSAGAWDIGFDYYVSAYNVTLSNPLASATGQTTGSGSCTVTYA